MSVLATACSIMILLEVKDATLVIVMNKGAIFCHVLRIMQDIHLIFNIICGNQKWNGAPPILIIKANISLYIAILLEKIEKGLKITEKEESSINEEPKA